MSTGKIHRRDFIKASATLGAASLLGDPLSRTLATASIAADHPIDIGSRLELFVDDFLIDRLTGANLTMHRPEPRDIVLTCDAPWEGNTSAYYTLFQDGSRFRAYYRGSHFDEKTKKAAHPEFTCYAESRDGLTFEKPQLGLFDFGGSTRNNIVWAGEGAHNFAPFRDDNPACAPDARYKALAGGTTMVDGKKRPCLHALKSPDGVRWTIMDHAVITAGAFDSQNPAFWDGARGQYRAYWRIFTAGYTDQRGWKPSGQRAIRTATSKDFLHWDNQADLAYVNSPPEHLYTNAVMPYFRAPHLLIGFPTRYQPKTEQVEPVFMSSRDGILFRRWPEELIPITAPQDRQGNRSNYMARGLLQLPGNEREISVYATEAYYAGPGSRLRRFVFRTDGFVSAHSDGQGELLTRLLQFTGNNLALNCRTARGGSVRVEIQDAAGRALPNFALDDCRRITGDHIAVEVTWRSGNVADLVGKPVRLRVALEQADVYAMQFRL